LSKHMQPSADLGIATLSEVLDPIALANHLRVASLSSGNGGAAEEVQVRALKHHPGRRCTLEIGLRAKNGWHFLIGKVYAKDHSDVFQAMDGIRQAGFGPEDEFSIPQPIAYLPSLRLLLQKKVEGPMAKEVFETGDEQSRAAAAERCAQWLARFQALAPSAGSVSYPRDLLNVKSIRRSSRKIAELGGHCADKAARLLQRLEDAAASLSPVEMRAGHGGYGATHVILSQDRTVVFDWDEYDVADPARDVGRFLATLRRRALGELGSIRALDSAAEVFLRIYLAEGRPEAERNLRFYEAAACLRLATRHLSNPVPHWEEKTDAMLDEGLRVLGREATQ
jgi:hypothetical protein